MLPEGVTVLLPGSGRFAVNSDSEFGNFQHPGQGAPLQNNSLREIGSGLRSCEGKLKHWGLSQAPGR